MSVYEIVVGDVHTLYMDDASFHTDEDVQCRAVACEYPATTFVFSDECMKEVPFCAFCTGHILMYAVGNTATMYPYSTTYSRVVKRFDDNKNVRVFTSIDEEKEHRVHDRIEIVRDDLVIGLVSTMYVRKKSTKEDTSEL